MTEGTLRFWEKRYRYYKSSDCPVCPAREQEKSRSVGFFPVWGTARRALEHAGIGTGAALIQHTEKEALALQGIGPTSMPVLKAALDISGFKIQD